MRDGGAVLLSFGVDSAKLAVFAKTFLAGAFTMLHLPILFLAASTVGQIDSNHEQLKAMEWTIGVWRRESVAEKDTRQAKKGDKTSKEWRFVWTANKNAILIAQVVTVNGKPVGQVDSLFGWNKVKQKVLGAGFSTDGVAGGGWTITMSDETFTITAGSSDWVFRKMGKDRLFVTTAGGKRHEYRQVEH